MAKKVTETEIDINPTVSNNTLNKIISLLIDDINNNFVNDNIHNYTPTP